MCSDFKLKVCFFLPRSWLLQGTTEDENLFLLRFATLTVGPEPQLHLVPLWLWEKIACSKGVKGSPDFIITPEISSPSSAIFSFQSAL
jgi:hypothetical protein